MMERHCCVVLFALFEAADDRESSLDQVFKQDVRSLPNA
jgi:hypothetical protein